MPTKLEEFKAAYPQYKDVDDQKLADALYDWGYAGKIDRRSYDAAIGLKPYDTTIEATGKALQNVPERFARGVGGLQQMLGEGAESSAQRIEQSGGGLLDFTGMSPEERAAAAQRVREWGADLAAAGKERIAQADKTMIPLDLAPGLSTAKVVSGAIGSTVEMLPALTLSILMRSPVPAMAGIGAQVGGDAYATARQQGLDPEQARQYSALYAAAEGIPEALPLGVLLKPGSTFLTRTVKGALAEGVQETFTEALQILVDKGYIKPDMTWGEVKERLTDAAVIGAVAGPLMAAYAHPVGGAVEKGYETAAQAVVNVQEKGARLIREFMPGTARVGPDKRNGPTMLDRVNAALRKRGFAPLGSIGDTPLHGETIDQTRYSEVIPPEPEVDVPPMGPEPKTIDVQSEEQKAAPQLPPPVSVKDKTVAEPGLPADVASIIEEEAAKAGVDPDTMKRIAWIESGGDPSAQNPNSSAGGLFQQTDGNAADYGVADRLDARQSAKGAAEFAADNTAFLTKKLGREPTPGELYLAHQQGPGGAAKLLENPDKLAVDVVGEDAVKLNGGTADMTAGEFAALWTSKMDGEMPAKSTGKAPPSVETGIAGTLEPGKGSEATPAPSLTLEEKGQTAPPELQTPILAPVERVSTPAKPVELERAPDLDTVRADINPQPTDGQKEAGNYKMAHVRWKGRDISIETGKGMERSGTAPDGTRWSVKMPADYGRIKGTVGMDGEQIDVYIGPNPESDRIFIVDQVDLETGKADEHKVIAGVETLEEAKLLYDSGFSDGKGSLRRANVTEIDEETFDKWLDEGDTTKPFKAIKPGFTKALQDMAAERAEKKRHENIDAGFAANRAVMKNFKKGQRVEFTHKDFYREPQENGSKDRVFKGTVVKISEKSQGIIHVRGDGGVKGDGYDVFVAARNLRPEGGDNGKPDRVAPESAEPSAGVPAPAVPGVEAEGQAGDVSGGAGRPDRAPRGGAVESGDDGNGSVDGGAKPSDAGDRTRVTLADYRIDPATIGTGGQKTKFDNNVRAIEILKDLEGRAATDAEKDALAKYVGWGGIPQAFKKPDGTYSEGWEDRAKKLEALLTKDELAAARRSTQDAHYTAPEVVQAIWRAVQRIGFNTGRVLEPSVGTGNFIGLRPHAVAAQFTAVELDPITASIATALYPKSKVFNQGFQDFVAPDGYFDLAIGNPPFGSQKLYDATRPHLNDFSIHNMFFAKSVDLLRPDGVLAMVVSNSFLDAVTRDKARRYIADRVEFLGAIRLPNNAFLKNAGTEVTTDIVFLRKLKEGEGPTGENWIGTEYVKDPAGGEDLPLNEYFVRHPDMMLGTMQRAGTMYRADMPALIAHEGVDLADALVGAIVKLPWQVMGDRTNAIVERSTATQVDKSVKAGSMFLADDGTVMVKSTGIGGEATAEAATLEGRALERAKGMIRIRDTLVELRALQLAEDADAAAMEKARFQLNKDYDAFVKEHGLLRTDANRRVFGDDPTWPQLAALEEKFDKGVSKAVAARTGEKAREPSAEKAAIFTKRTQSPYKAPSKAKSAKDALTASLSIMGKVDLDYMSQLYGQPEEAIIAELSAILFRDPASGNYATRDEYLSGNVKAKLAQARAAADRDPAFKGNVEALEAVQPADLEAADIVVKPGAHWVPGKYVAQFLDHLIEGRGSSAHYLKINGQWSLDLGDVAQTARVAWSTDRASIDRIIDGAFQQKPVQVFDDIGDGKKALNADATEAATEKANKVAQAWREWIFEDGERRRDLARLYNDLFNTTVQREYDGSHLQFPGKIGNDVITLRPHQANAVWRIMQAGPTLLDHVVGAGKTFTIVAGAMELRRTGFAKKPAVVVPNHLVGQWAEDFVALYPGARVLQTTKKDFEKGNRKRLMARIATGDWDAVIIAHSQFSKIEMDADFQADFLREQIAELSEGIQEMKQAEGKDSRTVKQAEKQREALENKLKKLLDTGRKDDNLTFGELGLDALFLDEAHEFKNLFYVTTMRGVMGMGNPAGSDKAADMFMKVQYVLRKTGDRNVVFATGTPISNTMAELYTLQRYLDYADLRQRGLMHFDVWARQFGQVTSDFELSVTGQYKLATRFAKFVNMPELMQRYQSFADVINRDDINRMLAAQGKTLGVPKLKGGKPQLVVVQPTAEQSAYVADLVRRAENMPKRPEKGADNMLKIMSDARKAALDMRAIDPNSDDVPTKTTEAVKRITALHKKWAKDKGTQLVFIDLSTPNGAKGKEAARIRALAERAEDGDQDAQEELDKLSPDEIAALDGTFSVYDDMRSQLIKAGIPEKEIAFIHDANTELQKQELFGKVRSGAVRVLFGSTAKMGAGMNVQERLVALHHMDAPWRPSDLEQREGRIIRQGNLLYARDPQGFEIEVVRYATERTLDARMWQTIEAKATFIEQIRKGANVREFEDVSGEAANAAEMKAAASGNPLFLEDVTLRKKIRTLENQRYEHDREQQRAADTAHRLQASVKWLEKEIPKAEADAKIDTSTFAAELDGETFEKPSEYGKAIIAKVAAYQESNMPRGGLGTMFGLPVSYDAEGEPVIILHAAKEYEASIKNAAAAEDAEIIKAVNEGRKAPINGLSIVLKLRSMLREADSAVIRMRARYEQEQADIPKLLAKKADWPQRAELEATKERHREVIRLLQAKPGEKSGNPVPEADLTDDDVSSMQAAGRQEEEADTFDFANDQPMPKYVETYRAKGLPDRVDAFPLRGKTVHNPPLDKPQRREGVRTLLEQIIGTRLYYGKIKGQSRLGFYRRKNSEVRIRDYDDIEVMAHEAAHYLDMHYKHRARFGTAAMPRAVKDEIKQLSYTSDPQKYVKEGFAEYVRLWSTQYDQAVAAAPQFTRLFETALAADPALEKKMLAFQEAAHKWYLQGPHAQLRAKSGEEFSPSETLMRFMQSYPAERLRQQAIDKIHAAKVIERTLGDGIADATRSAYKQFQMINGAESLHEAVVRDGTPRLAADGSFEFSGKGLNEVLWPVAKHGYQRFDLLLDYFKARRAQELMAQGREHLFSPKEIKAGLELARKYPDFVKVFDEYQDFNARMLDFFEDMQLITSDQREAFADMNKNYVPFHRITQRIEEGGTPAGTGPIGKRLQGGTANTRDIAVNIVEGLFTNIRGALLARAKSTLYSQIEKSQDGALFAAKIGPDSKKVKATAGEQAKRVAAVMVELGLGVTHSGMFVTMPSVNGAVYDLSDIQTVLERNPALLEFWLVNQPPKTDGDTYVDSVIIDGKRAYFEVREPLLVDMLTGLGGMKSGFILRQLFRVKNFQTRMVTSMLQFLGPNAWRDTLGAASMSKNDFVPIYDTLIGMAHFTLNTPLMKQFRLHGGGYGTRVEARTEERRARKAIDLPARNWWDTAAKVLAGYDRFISAFEYGSRVGDFRRATMAGKTKLEAAWEAREIATDFAKIGRNELWSKFIRTVPFMNAAIQSLDKVAREVSELDGEMKGTNLARLEKLRSKFVVVGAGVTLMTLLLWLLNNDDDRYIALTKDEKARFWWIFLPGVDRPLKIPRPYDLGHIFATLPETMLNYIKDRDGKEAADALAWTAVQTLGVGDYPGIFQPIIEVARNKDFRGSPIVPSRLADAPPELQFTDRTPQLYRALGKTLGVSPVVAQHYAKGYLRYLEQYIADFSEAVLWDSGRWGERPFVRGGPVDYLTHQFVGMKVPYRTKWTEGYYDLRARANGLKAAVSMLEAESVRDPGALNRVYGDKQRAALASLDQVFNKIDKAFSEQETILAGIKYSKALSAAEKERRIEAYYEQKNRALGQFYKQVKVELDRIERGLGK